MGTLTTKERQRFLHYLARTPIRIEVLRVSNQGWRMPPPEACRKIRRGEYSSNAFQHMRLYGRADWTRGGGDGRVALDVGCMLKDKAPMRTMIETLIHEICHVAFSTHWVGAKTKLLMRSPKVRRQAERRVLLALAQRGNIK